MTEAIVFLVVLSVSLFVALMAVYNRLFHYKALLHAGYRSKLESWREIWMYQAPDEAEWRDLSDSITRRKLLAKIKYYNLPDPEAAPKELQPADWR